MQGKFFLDTNIFVYSFDVTAHEKQRQARELIKSALRSGNGHISFQVIQEFFNVATRKFATPMSLPAGKEYFDKVFMQLEVVYPDGEYIKTALDIAATTGYSLYDALIISAALKAECNTLYTEDLQNGQKIRNLTLVNPFTS